jgi:hypothetical protein
LFLFFPHLEARLAWQPLSPGQPTVLTASLNENAAAQLMGVGLTSGDGRVVVSPPLRIPGLREISWRIQCQVYGRHRLTLSGGGQSETFELVASPQALEKILPEKRTRNAWNDWLAGGTPTLPRDSFVQQISVVYPEQQVRFLFWKWNWLVTFLVEVLVLGLLLKALLKVEI